MTPEEMRELGEEIFSAKSSDSTNLRLIGAEIWMAAAEICERQNAIIERLDRLIELAEGENSK